MTTLLIYDKTYSSWSMRAGVALRLAGRRHEELAYLPADEAGRAALKRRSPAGLFPVLEDEGLVIWDSLAIGEYLAERAPTLWPGDPRARAVARSLSAEMHSGFRATREALPMNLRAHYPGFHKSIVVRQELERLFTLWRKARRDFGAAGEYLFGPPTLADASFAPMIMRCRTYDVRLDDTCEAYARAVESLPAVVEWVRGAKAETHIEERYSFRI